MFGDPLLNPNGHLKEKIEKHINLLSGYPFKSEQYVEKGINICGGLIIGTMSRKRTHKIDKF